ncbi:TetR/AcrR family transcriptional regulator [Parvimonas micra]|uniref:TetR/AcrR family transcriptional regulator n=1 Tax=Parvimonas micra TaxID=33033 RepID=UPI00241F702F|nr:TetR/AcrR family transcriptional regulator [Parvimonas micra]
MTRERLTSKERKLKIQNIALDVFTRKGYKNTSMYDLVQATGLSTGGLYHYYKSTTEILYDLMLRGCKYREDIIEKKIYEISKPLSVELLAEITVDRALSTNIFIPIYVMFLQSMKEDEDLQELYKKLQDSYIKNFKRMLDEYDYGEICEESLKLLNDLLNTIILSCETLGIREHLVSQRQVLEKMIIDVLMINREEV